MDSGKPPITNCHTHIFTGDHVPPWLAKSFVWFPFYYLFPMSGIVRMLRWWYDGPNVYKHRILHSKLFRWSYQAKMFMARNFILSTFRSVVGWYLTVYVFFLCFDALNLNPVGLVKYIGIGGAWLRDQGYLVDYDWRVKCLFVFLLLVFFAPGRNLLVQVMLSLSKVLGTVFGKQTRHLISRYILIGRYARYKTQGRIFGRLVGQYPPGTRFVVLPMDMEYMDAGPLSAEHVLKKQMEGLVALKQEHGDLIHPFVFADPRRIHEDPAYFSCEVTGAGEVHLKDGCLVKKWLEEDGLGGIKIYPALGYYPFDAHLLLLWKYAADHQLPILTHCIKGTIFYRGGKKAAWDFHPVFRSYSKPEEGQPETSTLGPLLLPEREGVDFSTNFTHPLNYLCLLEEELLRQVIGGVSPGVLRSKLNAAFGYTDSDTPLRYTLYNLKICFGHFGGEEEWHKFYERDRDNYSSQLFLNPDRGIDFLRSQDRTERTPGKPAHIWKHVDWYTIICSLMLQYPQVYADVSYILHDASMIPLLKQTLQHPVLRKRVLYGSDFYVVRNHVSDKAMTGVTQSGLSEFEFDLLARYNPLQFLEHTVPVRT